jgi:hypothetical protein
VANGNPVIGAQKMLNHRQMEFVLSKIKWHLSRIGRGKRRTFFVLFPEDALSLRLEMEVGNGRVTSIQHEVEAITYEEGGLRPKGK